MKLAGKFDCEHLRGSTVMGPFWLSRHSDEEIKRLDKISGLSRINPNKLTWYLVPKDYQPMSKLKGIAKGQTVMIVGKGPGLDDLTEYDCIDVDLILACNDSVFKVCDVVGDTPVYNVQCDHLAGSCYDARSIPIVLADCAHFYTESEPMYLARVEDFGTPNWHPVGCTAIHIAKLMDCDKIVFAAFDGAFGGIPGYAKCIGKDPVAGRYSDPGRFSKHKGPMLKVLGNLPYTVLTPGATTPQTLTCDTLEQLPDNHGEQNERVHEECPSETQDTINEPYCKEPCEHETPHDH